MRCCSVRLLLVAMLATHHTDFESFTGARGPPQRRRAAARGTPTITLPM